MFPSMVVRKVARSDRVEAANAALARLSYTQRTKEFHVNNKRFQNNLRGVCVFFFTLSRKKSLRSLAHSELRKL